MATSEQLFAGFYKWWPRRKAFPRSRSAPPRRRADRRCRLRRRPVDAIFLAIQQLTWVGAYLRT